MTVETLKMPSVEHKIVSVANDCYRPAVIGPRKVSSMLGRSLSRFYDHRDMLEANGFPIRDALLGGWHAAAIDKWLARRAGLDAPGESSDKRALRRAIGARTDALRNAA
jgi:predicted DNA-binding transcriptional regulator AlpA